ncbi:alpha-glucosidase C-terminal domain-containing protein [uncultured Anaerococcus sp.]|uniref:alpha-glucosidase C-terminal domain-containing protein n=1 Tax=uncultured Anaerococcus sp. TaxID=293428 RepID=UPI0025E78DDF|nr:alpha-glucosidase C-terminal domain-containing protein [uncultured Anaerococcus sp.]
MQNLVLYRENYSQINKKITYYKRLGIHGLLINPFSEINEKIIEEIFALNDLLVKNNIKLFLQMDIEQSSKILLESDEQIDWVNPKIRTSFYQFINYLKKHKLKGFYYTNFEKLFADDFYFYIREMAKNIFLGEDTLSIGQINSDELAYQKFLSNTNYQNFDYIYNKRKSIKDRTSLLEAKKYFSSIQNENIRQIFITDNLLKNFINTKNFPFFSHSLVTGVTFLLNGGVLLENFEELGIFENNNYSNDHKVLDQTNKTFDFYKELINIKTNIEAIKRGTYREIFANDPDIFAFIRTYEEKKVIVFANFSQKEVLADIRFHFIDINDFKYFLGNYGKRKIAKNLLLRPYEFITFTK